MIGRILVALDESPRAPAVFAAAIEIASRFASSVRLMRAIEVPAEFPPSAAGSLADPLRVHLSNVATTELERFAATAPLAEVGPPIIRIGEPWRLILAVSEELDVDLVVLGSHGYGGIDRILGTTAGKVANESKRNVLVVHERFSRSSETVPVPSRARAH